MGCCGSSAADGDYRAIKVQVSIQWCGGSGNGPHFNASRALITKWCPKAQIKSLKDSGTTGNFEIKVDGVLVHSKATKGHGFLDENQTQQSVVKAALARASAGNSAIATSANSM